MQVSRPGLCLLGWAKEECNTFFFSSGEFADDSNEGGVLVLEPLVVCSEVPQNLQRHHETVFSFYTPLNLTVTQPRL